MGLFCIKTNINMNVQKPDTLFFFGHRGCPLVATRKNACTIQYSFYEELRLCPLLHHFTGLAFQRVLQARVLTFTCSISLNKTEGFWEFVAFFIGIWL